MGQPRKAVKPFAYVDNPELHRQARLKILINKAQVLLNGKTKLMWQEDLFLFKGLHACGYVINHPHKGRVIPKQAKQLKTLYGHILEELVKHNSGLVWKMKGKINFVRQLDEDEVMSSGFWVLYRAILLFDPWRGICFSTYACTSILREFLGLKKRSDRQQKNLSNFSDYVRHLSVSKTGLSLDKQIQIDQLRLALDENRAGLTTRECFVVEHRLIYDYVTERETLEAIGDMLGLTKERVRQIEMSGVGKLRRYIEIAETVCA